MRLLFDMDDVIADFTGRVLELYNHYSNTDIKPEDITTYDISKCLKNKRLFFRIKDDVGFIQSLKPLPGALEAVELLSKDNEIVFVSNATNGPTSGHEKRQWLKYYFGHIWDKPKLVLTYHKHLVPGYCLLDDRPKNLENLEHGTIPLLFVRPSNHSEERFKRIVGWDHFLVWIKNERQKQDER